MPDLFETTAVGCALAQKSELFIGVSVFAILGLLMSLTKCFCFKNLGYVENWLRFLSILEED